MISDLGHFSMKSIAFARSKMPQYCHVKHPMVLFSILCNKMPFLAGVLLIWLYHTLLSEEMKQQFRHGLPVVEGIHFNKRFFNTDGGSLFTIAFFHSSSSSPLLIF